MDVDLTVTRTEGFARGYVFQFAEGRLPDLGHGVSFSEEAFDRLVPFLERAIPHWQPMARYGVTELSYADCQMLATALRGTRDADFTATALFVGLADWLTKAAAHTETVSLLGV